MSSTLTAREDGRRGLLDLLGLRRREDEDHSRRWFLEDLEQGVPRLPREHVGLVHDVDLESIRVRRRVHGALTQTAGIVHATVRGGVDLDHIQRRVPTPDPSATVTDAARLALVGPLWTVEGHRENAGERRLPHASGAAEEVGMRYPSRRDGATERLGNVALVGYVSETSGPESSGESLVGHVDGFG